MPLDDRHGRKADIAQVDKRDLLSLLIFQSGVTIGSSVGFSIGVQRVLEIPYHSLVGMDWTPFGKRAMSCCDVAQGLIRDAS